MHAETQSENPSDSESDSTGELEQENDIFNETWAEEVLQAHGDKSAKNIEVKVSASIAGALSRVINVSINYEIKGEHKTLPVVVKLPPKDPFARLFVAEAQFDTREILFYTTIAPDLERLAKEFFGDDATLPIPKLIKAKLPDEIGGASELVLEDVTFNGFEPSNFKEGLTLDKAKAALGVAAKIHALSLALQEREGSLEKKYDFLFPRARAAAGYLRLARRGLPQLETFLRPIPGCEEDADAIANLISSASALLDRLLELPESEPMSLVHADFWSGNLLFRTRDNKCECLVLDWQMASLGRSMDDVALLILSSLEAEIRREFASELIEEYGSLLEKECAKCAVKEAGALVRSSLATDWNRGGLRALLLCAGSVDMALGCVNAEKRLKEAVRDLREEGALALS